MTSPIERRIQVFNRDDALGRWSVATCLPHAALESHIASYWFGEGQIHYRRDRILPNAGSFLLINLGPTQFRIESGPPERRVPFRDIWYSGLHQGPIETEAPFGSALLGVAFKYAGARPVLRGVAQEFSDRIVALTDVLGDGVLQLREHLGECTNVAQRFALLERWLLSRWCRKHAAHALVDHAMTAIMRRGGRISVESLCDDAGVSRRYLSKLFQRDVGLTPKAVTRVLRFQGALTLLAGRSQVPWDELALHCGYYDQSHLTRDFKQFSGFTPGEFVRMARPDAGSVVVE